MQQLKSECRAEEEMSLHSFSGFVGGKPWLALQRNQSLLLTQRLATILPNSLNGWRGYLWKALMKLGQKSKNVLSELFVDK